MGTPGPIEIGLVLLIVLIFVGPKKLPGLGKSLGTGLREFKDSVSGGDKKDDLELEHRPPAAPPVAPPVAEPVREPAAEPSLSKDPAAPPAPPREPGE